MAGNKRPQPRFIAQDITDVQYDHALKHDPIVRFIVEQIKACPILADITTTEYNGFTAAFRDGSKSTAPLIHRHITTLHLEKPKPTDQVRPAFGAQRTAQSPTPGKGK